MSTRTTLILLLVLIVVVAGVYLLEFRNPAGQGATAGATSSAPTSLLTVSLPAISGITVRDVVSGTTVSATRDVSGTWWLAQPAGQPADPASLSSMAQQLSNIYVQRTLTPTGSLADYGLVTPTLTVEVTTAEGATSFGVGDETPSKGAYYVQKSGDPHVYLVDTSLVDNLKQFAGKPPVAQPPTPAAGLPALPTFEAPTQAAPAVPTATP